MANHMGESARILAGSVNEMDNVVPDNIPYEVYNSMADLLLSQPNSAGAPQPQHHHRHPHHSLFFPPTEATVLDSSTTNSSPSQIDWFQQMLMSQNQNLSSRSSPFYTQQSQQQQQQHYRYDEDSLEMDPLPGDLLHELNLKSEVPPLPHSNSNYSCTDHFLDQQHQHKSFSKPSNSHKYCASAISAMVDKYGNLGQSFSRPAPPALMDLQPEPSERLTTYASSLLDAVSHEGSCPRDLTNCSIGGCNATLIANGTMLTNRRIRGARGRKRVTNSHYYNEAVRGYQQIASSEAPRLTSTTRHFSTGAPGSCPDGGELMNSADSAVGSLGLVNDEECILFRGGAGCFASSSPPCAMFLSDGSVSRGSSTSSSEPPVQALTRPSYSEIIKKSSGTGAAAACAVGVNTSGGGNSCHGATVSNMDLLSLCRGNADGAEEQQHLSGTDDAVSISSSERSNKFSISELTQSLKQSNHLMQGQRSGQDKTSIGRITSHSTPSNDECITSDSMNASSKAGVGINSGVESKSSGLPQRKFFDPKRIFRPDVCESHVDTPLLTRNYSWRAEDEEKDSEVTEQPTKVATELLNNAKSSFGKPSHTFPPPAASFIANDLTFVKKRSNTEEEHEALRHKTSTHAAQSSTPSPSAHSSPTEPVKRANLVLPDVHLPPGAAVRRSKAAKRKTRRLASACKVEAGPASRAAVAVTQWLKTSVGPYLHWLLWNVLFVAVLFAVRVVWVALAGLSATAGNHALVFGQKALNLIWRRLRPLLPGFGGWSSGARHGGRRKKTGSRKPAWMPPGLQANIDLPDTGEDAMKRLLACKEKDAYSVLGVRRDAREEEITHYYRRQALLVHPDKNLEPGAGEAFKILAGAFELVGCPERRREYDIALETARLQSEEAMEQFSDMVTKLQERMEEVMNTLKCDKCGGGHRRHRVEERSTAEARHCAQCQAFHAAREGDLWAEASCLGFRWRYYACMEDGVYNVTDFIACRSEQFKNMTADSHNVLFRLSTTNWRRFKKPQDNLEDLLEDLLPRMGCDVDADEEQHQHASGPKATRRSCGGGGNANNSPHNSTTLNSTRKSKSVRRGRRN